MGDIIISRIEENASRFSKKEKKEETPGKKRVYSFPLYGFPTPGWLDNESVSKEDLIVFPTDTVYGIGVSINTLTGIERIYELKKRAPSKRMALYFPSLEEALAFARDISEPALNFMRLFMPGPVTVLLRAAKHVPAVFVCEGKVGIRVQGNPVLNELLRKLNVPLAGTSANLSGGKSPATFSEIPGEIIEAADIVIDNGTTLYARESTIVDLSEGNIKIVREGAVSAELIERTMHYREGAG